MAVKNGSIMVAVLGTCVVLIFLWAITILIASLFSLIATIWGISAPWWVWLLLALPSVVIIVRSIQLGKG